MKGMRVSIDSDSSSIRQTGDISSFSTQKLITPAHIVGQKFGVTPLHRK